MLPRLSVLVGVVLVSLTASEVECARPRISLDEILDFSSYLEKTSLIDKPKIGGGVLLEGPVGAQGGEWASEAAEGEGAEEGEEEHVSPDAWERSGKFEGDIVLSPRQRRLIVEDVAQGLSRNGLRDITKRWPNNELVYYIQKEHFSSGQVQAIQDGLDDIARSSCVTFRPFKKGDPDAVVIVGNRRGCFSAVGYQSGYQVLNLSARHPLGRGCFRHGTVVHEILHSLGFYHMQSSPSRDDYINVNWDNIIEGAKHNFRKYNTFSVSDFGVPYDYDSVLHYSKRAFSQNGQATLVPKKDGAEIGQRRGMSDGDIQKLNKMYCDKDSGSSFDDVKEIQKKAAVKKKANINKPFEGHGLGYYQGKSVIVKLPKIEVTEMNEQEERNEPFFNDNMKQINTEYQFYGNPKNMKEDSDEVFIDISKIMAGIGIPKTKPMFEGFVGISGLSKEDPLGQRHEDSNDSESPSSYRNYFSDRESGKTHEDFGGSEKQPPQYDDFYGFNKAREAPKQPNRSYFTAISMGHPYDAYSQFNPRAHSDKSNEFSPEGDIKSTAPVTYSGHERIKNDGAIKSSSPEGNSYSNYNGKYISEDVFKDPAVDSAEKYNEGFFGFNIPASVRDWWS